MKKYLFILLLFISFSLYSQNNNVKQGTKNIAVLYESGKPIKVYADITDCIHFMMKNESGSYSNQQVNLHYKEIVDTTKWQPNSKMLQDDIWNPKALDDKYLAKDSVYVVMQNNFDLVDRVYDLSSLDECVKYANNFNQKYFKVLYLYRNKESYDKIYEIKRKRK